MPSGRPRCARLFLFLLIVRSPRWLAVDLVLVGHQATVLAVRFSAGAVEFAATLGTTRRSCRQRCLDSL